MLIKRKGGNPRRHSRLQLPALAFLYIMSPLEKVRPVRLTSIQYNRIANPGERSPTAQFGIFLQSHSFEIPEPFILGFKNE
jgi:hypothetical protein